MSTKIICCHCGAELPAEQTICTKCGCRALKYNTITFIKAPNSYMKSALTVINVYNATYSTQISLYENVMQQEVELPIGTYKIDVIAGMLNATRTIDLGSDITFEVGIKLGLFANKVFINQIN